MNTLAYAQNDARAGAKPRATGRGLRAKAHIAGAAVGLAGSVTAALSGSFLIVAGWMVANEGARQWISTAGSVLLLLTIPLVSLGACCLDWVEKDGPRRRPKAAYDEADEDL